MSDLIDIKMVSKVGEYVWYYGTVTYTAEIYWDSNQFLFEGHRTEGIFPKMHGREPHEPFPWTNRPIIKLGKREEAIKFLNKHLPLWDCPPDVLKRLTDKVRNWPEA